MEEGVRMASSRDVKLAKVEIWLKWEMVKMLRGSKRGVREDVESHAVKLEGRSS